MLPANEPLRLRLCLRGSKTQSTNAAWDQDLLEIAFEVLFCNIRKQHSLDISGNPRFGNLQQRSRIILDKFTVQDMAGYSSEDKPATIA